MDKRLLLLAALQHVLWPMVGATGFFNKGLPFKVDLYDSPMFLKLNSVFSCCLRHRKGYSAVEIGLEHHPPRCSLLCNPLNFIYTTYLIWLYTTFSIIYNISF